MKPIRSAIIFLLVASMCIIHCAHLKEAQDAYKKEDYASAIRLCKQAIAADSTDTQAFRLLSKCYLAFDSLKAALGMIERAHQLQPESAAIIREKCRIHLASGNQFLSRQNHVAALSHFRSAEKLCPDNTTAVLGAANVYFEIGRLEEAQSRYQKSHRALEDTAFVRKRLVDIEERTRKAQVLYQQGRDALDRNRLKTAKNRFEKAVEEKADFPDAQYHLSMTEGKLLYRQGSKSAMWDAVEVFGKAASIRPDSAEPHFWLAQAYEKKDRDEFTNAIDEYQTALTLEPDGPRADTCKKKIADLKKRKEKLDKFWGRKE